MPTKVFICSLKYSDWRSSSRSKKNNVLEVKHFPTAMHHTSSKHCTNYFSCLSIGTALGEDAKLFLLAFLISSENY